MLLFYLVVKQIVNHSNEIDVKIRHKKNVNLLLKIVIIKV